MPIQYRTRQLPHDVLITSVHCAICRRFVTTGQYTIAPAESIYAGKPVCAGCIDLVPPAVGKQAGPSERKVVEPEEKKGTEGSPFPLPPEMTAGKWKLEY